MSGRQQRATAIGRRPAASPRREPSGGVEGFERSLFNEVTGLVGREFFELFGGVVGIARKGLAGGNESCYEE